MTRRGKANEEKNEQKANNKEKRKKRRSPWGRNTIQAECARKEREKKSSIRSSPSLRHEAGSGGNDKGVGRGEKHIPSPTLNLRTSYIKKAILEPEPPPPRCQTCRRLPWPGHALVNTCTNLFFPLFSCSCSPFRSCPCFRSPSHYLLLLFLFLHDKQG